MKKTKETSMNGEAGSQSAQSGIDSKVANILAYTQNFAEASAKKNDDDKVLTLLRFARNFAASGNLESAMVHVQRAYKINPLHPEISIVERMLIQRVQGDTNNEVKEEAADEMKKSGIPIAKEFDQRQYVELLGLEHEPPEIQACLAKAEYFRQLNDMVRASEMIVRAYELDPFNESIARIEHIVNVSTAVPEHSIEEIIKDARNRLRQNDFTGVQETIAKAYALDPFNERILMIEETVRLGLKKELNPVEHCLLAAHRHYNNGDFIRSKEEIYLGYLIDPLNQQLSRLEEQIKLSQNG
ncbi:MAG: hypothetical protein ACOYNS_04490 [Bacteroidota bacterium]